MPRSLAHEYSRLHADFHVTQKAARSMTDRELMNVFVFVDALAPMSSGFVIICSELGARGYDPHVNEIKQRLS
jgi:hypothetical protein